MEIEERKEKFVISPRVAPKLPQLKWNERTDTKIEEEKTFFLSSISLTYSIDRLSLLWK